MSRLPDFNSLGFGYVQTDSHIRYIWRNGKWDAGQLLQDPHVNLHIAATVLHYGQAGFEGLKAFRHKDDSIHVFRERDNARRMMALSDRIMMPVVPEEMFCEAIHRLLAANRDWVPPYESGGSAYIRPFLIGSGGEIGLRPASEYMFMVLMTPVGSYYKGGVQAISALVMDDYDRAAPRGTGDVKVAGNYAASLKPGKLAQEQGFQVALYLDAAEHRFIEEFGTSNFVGLTADQRYVTPRSRSILPSITNRSLMTIAEDLGYRVEERPVEFSELSRFAEVGACGTAVVVTPVNRIVRGGREWRINDFSGFGPGFSELYGRYRAIQRGEAPDTHGWLTRVKAD